MMTKHSLTAWALVVLGAVAACSDETKDQGTLPPGNDAAVSGSADSATVPDTMSASGSTSDAVVTPDNGAASGATADSTATVDGVAPDGSSSTPDGTSTEAAPPPTDCPANPVAVDVAIDISVPTTWTCANTYVLKKWVEVQAGATLNIGPGVRVIGDPASTTVTGIVVLPGAKIYAKGTKAQPIVMTSGKSPRRRGDWSGLMVIGKAKTNHPAVAFPEGQTARTQWGYGSTGADRNDDDDSGELSYVRVEWAGYQLQVGNEINAYSFYGVGRGTTLHHLQAHQGLDDSFEWFGGSVNAKYLLASSGNDDCFDIDNGFSGKLQFGICVRDDVDGGGNGFEVDNDATGTANLPQTHPTVYNFTLIGKGNTLTTEGGFGFHLRRNTAGTFRNILAVNWPLAGLFIDGTATQANATAGALSVRNSIVSGIAKNGNDAFADGYIAGAENAIRTAPLADVKLTNVASSAPNMAIAADSPAMTGAATAPTGDMFLESVPFVGACGTSCPEFEGWTSFSAAQ